MEKINHISKHKITLPTLLAIVFVIGIIFRLILLGQDPSVIQSYQTDDSYFYYSMARNTIKGNGVVLNSGIPTNGYHPLHLVLLTPIFFVFYSFGIDVPIYATLAFLLVLNLLTGVFLYRSLKIVFNEKAGFLACAIWVLNPQVVRYYLSGMEIGLQIFFLSILTYYLVSRKGWLTYSIRQAITVGVLIGLTFLSRMDGAFVAIGFGIVFLIKYSLEFDRVNWFQQIQPLMITTLTTFLCSLPWFVYSLYSVGRITPISSEGITFEATSILPPPILTLIYEVIRQFAASFVQTIVIFPSPWFIVYLLVAIISLILIVHFVVTRRDSTKDLVSTFGFLIVAAFLYYPYYTFYQLRVRWYYTLFTSFLTAILLSVVIIKMIERIENKKIKHAATAAVSLLIIFNLLIGGFQIYGIEGNASEKKVVANYLEDNISENEKIAAIGGGGYQYYDETHDILMLASVINPEALEAWKSGRIESYLVEKNITYIINHRGGIDVLEKALQNHEFEVVRSWDGPGDFEPTLVKMKRIDE